MKDPVWEQGPRVRVDSLRKGDEFLDIQGGRWVYERKDGALSGALWVTNDTGFKTCFAGCAEVVVQGEQR